MNILNFKKLDIIAHLNIRSTASVNVVYSSCTKSTNADCVVFNTRSPLRPDLTTTASVEFFIRMKKRP